MYIDGALQCLSFHVKKHIPIGRGGMILLDDFSAYKWLKRARFDGRSECAQKEDTFDMLGWNMYLTPEQASRGLTLFQAYSDEDDIDDYNTYPDLSKFEVFN